MRSLPWGHHFLLIERLGDRAVRRWYAAEAVREGWSRDALASMLKTNAHLRAGAEQRRDLGDLATHTPLEAREAQGGAAPGSDQLHASTPRRFG
jgi:predicted nuclease of restriction endonuclease-like (RecB) superfamily